MDNLKKLVLDNKYIVIIILLVLAICLVWFFGFREKFETLDNTSPTDASVLMNGLIGKNVYITCDVAGLKHYLAILQQKDCAEAKSKLVGECQFNIPIFQNQKNEQSVFEIGKHATENKYTIRSLNKALNSPFLTQNLNYYSGNDSNNKLCFDNDTKPEIIYFETELVESGVLIKFKKNSTNYWIGVCAGQDAKCNQDIRLCLFLEKHLAVPFRFEMTTPPIIPPIIPPVKKEKFTNTIVESFEGDLSSLYSNNTFNSDGTIMESLPGFDSCGNCGNCMNHRIYQNL